MVSCRPMPDPKPPLAAGALSPARNEAVQDVAEVFDPVTTWARGGTLGADTGPKRQEWH